MWKFKGSRIVKTVMNTKNKAKELIKPDIDIL